MVRGNFYRFLESLIDLLYFRTLAWGDDAVSGFGDSQAGFDGEEEGFDTFLAMSAPPAIVSVSVKLSFYTRL